MKDSNIVFDEFKIKSRSILGQSESPAMIRYLMKKGIVKNEKSANGILLGVIVVSLLASAYVFAVFVFDINVGTNNVPQQTEEVRARREEIQKIRQQRINNAQTVQ